MEDLAIELAPNLTALATSLGAPAGGQTSFLSQNLKIDASNRENWDEMADWLDAKVRAYQKAFGNVYAAEP